MTSAIRDGERWRSEKAPSQNALPATRMPRSEEHTSELQSRLHLVCRLLLEKKKPFNMPTSQPRLPLARVSIAPAPRRVPSPSYAELCMALLPNRLSQETRRTSPTEQQTWTT